MFGQEMRNALHTLSRRFDQLAQPAQGRYINEPAVTDETGVLYIPPAAAVVSTGVKIAAISLAVITVGLVLYQQAKKRNVTTSDIAARGKRVLDKITHPSRKATSQRFKTFDQAFPQ
jgi:hypothetical protein